MTGGPARSHDGDRSKNSSSTAQAEEVRQLRRSSSIRPGKEATEQGPAGGRSPLPRGGQNDGEIATQACDSGADSTTPGTVRLRSRPEESRPRLMLRGGSFAGRFCRRNEEIR